VIIGPSEVRALAGWRCSSVESRPFLWQVTRHVDFFVQYFKLISVIFYTVYCNFSTFLGIFQDLLSTFQDILAIFQDFWQYFMIFWQYFKLKVSAIF
jgi:hypothetical protein